jgi:hypothetical protein
MLGAPIQEQRPQVVNRQESRVGRVARRLSYARPGVSFNRGRSGRNGWLPIVTATVLVSLTWASWLPAASAAPITPTSTSQPYSWHWVGRPNILEEFALTNLAWNPLAGYEMAISSYNDYDFGTYAYEDGNWTDLHVSVPSSFVNAGVGGYLLYDVKDRQMLLVEPWAPSYTCNGKHPAIPIPMWKEVRGAWVKVTATNGPLVSTNPCLTSFRYPSVVYDASDGMLLLYGSLPPSTKSGVNETYQTWGYRAGSWTHFTGPGPSSASAQVVYDPGLAKVLLVGEGYWTFHGGSWSMIDPNPHPYWKTIDAYAGEAGYDPAIPGVVFAGDVNESGNLSVWLWKDGSNGIVNITSEVAGVHSASGALECYSYGYAYGLAAGYDPDVSGLVCPVETNSALGVGLWEFT